MSEFWKNTFGKFHSVVIENNLEWIYVVISVLVLLSSLVTWILNNLKTKVEIGKLINEKLKLNEEIHKIKSEKKKINKETENLEFDNKKTIQETKNLAITEKEKLINITKGVVEMNESYNANLELFLISLKELYIKSTENKIEKYELDIIINLFYSRIINPFSIYFKMWKILYESDKEETNDFINIRLKPYLNLSTSLLEKLVELGGELNGTMVSSDVFKPIIDFSRLSENSQTIDEQIDKLCVIFDCKF